MRDDRNPVWRRYRDLLRRKTAADVQDELHFHVQMRADEAKRAGLTDAEARAAALERFGRFGDVEAELLQIDGSRARKRDRAAWLGDLHQDVRFAVRSLRRAPAFTVAAIATLTLAIGANTAIFSVVNALLLAPLPYGAPEQLVSLWGNSTGELLLLRERLRSESEIASYYASSADVDDGNTAERIDGAIVSVNLFTLLRSPASAGRTFAANEDQRGNGDVVVLSDALWHRRFGGDSTVVGRRIAIDGKPATVIGIMPPTFRFPSARTEFWKPLTVDRGDAVSLWAYSFNHLIGRLRPGMTVDAARREILSVAPTLRHSNTIWDPGPDYGHHADVRPLQDSIVGGSRTVLLLLFGCVGVVLIVACVNVANLLLARASAREQELAVRAAVGGGRGRLIRQLLTESVVLSLLGGVAGTLLAAATIRWLVAALPPSVPRTAEIGISGATLGFTLALTILTGVAFGLLPALRATRRDGSADTVGRNRSATTVSHQRVSSLLIVGEVALAVLLVIGAELLVRSFRELQRLDPGFRPDHLVTARVTPAPGNYADGARTTAFYRAVLDRATAMPGVENVAAVSSLPLAGPVYGAALRIEGQFEDVKHGLPVEDHAQTVTPGYFAAMRIPLIRGRGFNEGDAAAAEPVAVISQSMANRFWKGVDPIGKRVGYPWNSPWMTIVGVVADVRADSLRDTSAVAVYTPFLQRVGNATEFTVIVRTANDPATAMRSLRSIVAGVDRGVPVSELRSMDDVISRSLDRPRFVMLLVGAFAGVSLLLGAVGIYGVMSYIVRQRSQEIGLRMAFGAAPATVLLMVVQRAAGLAGAGALLGAAAAFVAVRPLRALLFGVSTSDPMTYLAVPALFILVAIVAALAPARRATKVDPVSAIRM